MTPDPEQSIPTHVSADGRLLPIEGKYHDQYHDRCHGTGFLSLRVFTADTDRSYAYDCSCRVYIASRPNFDRDCPTLAGMSQDELDAAAAASGADFDAQVRGVALLRSMLKGRLRDALEAWITKGCPGGAPGLAEAVDWPVIEDSPATIGRPMPEVTVIA